MSFLSRAPSSPGGRSSFRSARGFASLLGGILCLWLVYRAYEIYSVPLPPAAGPPSLDGYTAAPYDANKQGLGFSYGLTEDELAKEAAGRKYGEKLLASTSSSSSSATLTSSSSTSSSSSTTRSTITTSRSTSSSTSSTTSSVSTTSGAPVSTIPTASASTKSTSTEAPELQRPAATTTHSTTRTTASTASTATSASDSLDFYGLDQTSSGLSPQETSGLLTTSDEFEIVEDAADSGSTGEKPDNFYDYSTTIIVGRLDRDPAGVAWIRDILKDISKKAVYIVDDPNAPLHLDRNKGREAMVYLKYIIEHYDKLSDVSIFFHSSRMAWHNNILMNKDGAIMVNNLRRKHVVDVGYFNMRCELYPGCPQWIKFNPTREENQWFPERTADLFTIKLWDQIFPNRTHDPVFLAQPCCSQFALSRDKIRSVPLHQYELIRDWLFETDIADGYAGRIMEYVWQYLWLEKDEHCPPIPDCYCKGYGLCLEQDKAQKVIHYSNLRQKMDEEMAVFGNWDQEHCKQIPEGAEKRKCKDGNPYVPPFLQTRKEKLQLEESLAKEMGIMEP